MLDIVCSCGSTSKFLREKAKADNSKSVGLYCYDCLKWIKWVGKKDVPKLQARGMKIHPESFIPQGSESSVHTGPQNFNGASEPVYNAPSSHQVQPNEVDSLPESFTSGGINNVYPAHTEENDLDDLEDYGEVVPSSEAYCITCETGKLEELGKLQLVKLAVRNGGVLNVYNKDETKLYASLSVNFCPTCGKKLS